MCTNHLPTIVLIKEQQQQQKTCCVSLAHDFEVEDMIFEIDQWNTGDVDVFPNIWGFLTCNRDYISSEFLQTEKTWMNKWKLNKVTFYVSIRVKFISSRIVNNGMNFCQ